jgi:hypothetical protein
VAAVSGIPRSGGIGRDALADRLERQTPIGRKLLHRWAACSAVAITDDFYYSE